MSKKKNKLTNISLKELEKLEKENPQANIVRIPKKKAKKICEDCGEKKEGTTYLIIGNRWGETTDVYLCNKCAKQYEGNIQRRKKYKGGKNI